MFSKLLIANRGEIACRVLRTARRLGIRTVAVYSEADAQALHVRLADEAYRIGPAPARASYLDGAAILAAARRAGAGAIHPGYGFLSENAAFAEAVTEAGLIFIGPPARAIRAMGDKAEAKALMAAAGVPLIPGHHGQDQDPAVLAGEAARIGFPVLIKAAAGGGGKGMKVATGAGDFAAALAGARREAAAAFGDDRVLLERYLERARHVEIQIFADSHGQCLSLFERDCSIQRRHQKVIEEAPAPNLEPGLRRRMGEAAVVAARAVGYVGAGTVEFLLAPDDGPNRAAFYFMEMNTRLQVEHPVTEMIIGHDLVEWQLRVAAGEPLPAGPDRLVIHGHAIEARLYAENPEAGFLPQTGRLERLDLPAEGPHVRVDSGMRAGDSVSSHYDPLIAKLIVWDRDRPAAVRRLRAALAETRVAGLVTNIRFLAALASHPAFAAAELDTRFVERHHADLVPEPAPVSDPVLMLAALGVLLSRAALAQTEALAAEDPWSPWALADGWRLNEEAQQTLDFRDGSSIRTVTVVYRRTGYRFSLPDDDGGRDRDGADRVLGELAEDGTLEADFDGVRLRAIWERRGAEITVFHGGSGHRLSLVDVVADAATEQAPPGRLVAPMSGRVVALLVAPGATVEANQPVIVIEAMKMEHTVKATLAGRLRSYPYAVGDQVEEGAELAVVEEETKEGGFAAPEPA
jgi:3-methylcrotonyl-CoA carboxylase alpha subunit